MKYSLVSGDKRGWTCSSMRQCCSMM